MHNNKFTKCVTGVFVTIVLFFGHVSLTHAELINNAQVEGQTKEVFLAIVGTLQEHVKLLQMVLIQKLETQVEHLESLAANQ